MGNFRRTVIWIGAGLLWYSLLLASWVDVRTLPEVMRGLWVSLQRGGNMAVVTRLLVEFLVLYLLAITLSYLWLVRARGHLELGGGWYLGLGLLGAGLTIALSFQGGGWHGVVTALLGFLGLGGGVWWLSRQEPATWEGAAQLAAREWRPIWMQARAQNIPLAVALCRTRGALSGAERLWLSRELRAEDRILFFRQGAVLLLWNARQDQAMAALRHLTQDNTATDEPRHYGVAFAPQDGETLSELIRHAAFAQGVAARLGTAIQTVADTRLPEDVLALTSEEIGATQAAGMLHLRAAWSDLRTRKWQAFLVHFDPPAMAGAIEKYLRRMLRGADLVVQVSPYRILVVLPDTDATGGERMLQRFRQELLPETLQVAGQVHVHPLGYQATWSWADLLRKAFEVADD